MKYILMLQLIKNGDLYSSRIPIETSNAAGNSYQAVQCGKLRASRLVSISILVAVAHRVIKNSFFAVTVQ